LNHEANNILAQSTRSSSGQWQLVCSHFRLPEAALTFGAKEITFNYTVSHDKRLSQLSVSGKSGPTDQLPDATFAADTPLRHSAVPSQDSLVRSNEFEKKRCATLVE